MQTLNKLMRKLIDNVNETCNHSIESHDVERAAALIDDYLGEAWNHLLDNENDPWDMLMASFIRINANEKDDAVTFISYIILTQCMLNDKKK